MKYLSIKILTCMVVAFLSIFPVFAFSDTGLQLAEKPVNIPVALLRSAVIPGWGELSIQNQSGYFFITAEVALWCARIYYQQESRIKKNEYYNYALKYAGITPGSKSSDYFFHLSRYNHSGFGPGGYNEHVLTRARSLYPDDDEAITEYVLANAYMDDSESWDWRDREHRRKYSIMHRDSDVYLDYVKAFTGTLIANRVISVINTLRIGAQRNRRIRELNDGFSMNIYFDQNMDPFIMTRFSF